jgi:hypothetical protein
VDGGAEGAAVDELAGEDDANSVRIQALALRKKGRKFANSVTVGKINWNSGSVALAGEFNVQLHHGILPGSTF